MSAEVCAVALVAFAAILAAVLEAVLAAVLEDIVLSLSLVVVAASSSLVWDHDKTMHRPRRMSASICLHGANVCASTKAR